MHHHGPNGRRRGRATALALGLTAAALAAALAASTAGAAPLGFSAPLQLPKSAPGQPDSLGGGEPSLAFDPAGNGTLFVTAPQGIPTAAGSVFNGSTNTKGIGFWASYDHGLTFPNVQNIGAANGGGDTDVAVGTDGHVYAADLEAAATDICISTDHGKTFGQGCDTGITTDQQGPENDRQWLTTDPRDPKTVYLTYHDFVGGFPIIEKSTDGGLNFSPCGTIIDPAGPAGAGSAGGTYQPANGTLVSKPQIAPDGTIYVEFTTPDSVATPVGASLNHLYLAKSKGCDASTVFTDTLIYSDPGADLANIFQAFARDAAGRLYVVAAGQVKAKQTDTALYLFTSDDNGTTWSPPLKVNPPALGANVLPAAVGGNAKGEMAIGWFGTATSSDPNTQTNEWRFYEASTFDGGQTFAYSTITRDPIHYGDICTQGLFCGLVPGQPGNRNLADFASVAVEPKTGCVTIALPGDPYNKGATNTFGSSAYLSRQTAGPCLDAATSGSPAAGVVGAAPGGGGAPGPMAIPVTGASQPVIPATSSARTRLGLAFNRLGGPAARLARRSRARGVPIRVRVRYGTTVKGVRVTMYRLVGARRTVVASLTRPFSVSRTARTVYLRLAKGRRISRGRYLIVATGTASGAETRASTSQHAALK